MGNTLDQFVDKVLADLNDEEWSRRQVEQRARRVRNTTANERKPSTEHLQQRTPSPKPPPPPPPRPLVRVKNEEAYGFFQTVLNSPRHVAAPMVLGSELPFRMMLRKYGADLCYTPMFKSCDLISVCEQGKMQDMFRTCPEDRPLVGQLCSNKPEEILKAAKFMEPYVDAIDINLGCPQRCAKLHTFGAFLMDYPDLVQQIVETLKENLSIPVFCKIRLLPTFEETLSFVKMLESAGCHLLAVHGRRREKVHHDGPADLEMIARLRQHLSIPVLSNGNIREPDDISVALETSGAEGVMCATSLLRNPKLFSGVSSAELNIFATAREYLDFCAKYAPPKTKAINDHLLALFEALLTEDVRTLFRNHLQVNTLEQFSAIVDLIENRQTGAPQEYTIKEIRKRDFYGRIDVEEDNPTFVAGMASLFGSGSDDGDEEDDEDNEDNENDEVVEENGENQAKEAPPRENNDSDFDEIDFQTSQVQSGLQEDYVFVSVA